MDLDERVPESPRSSRAGIDQDPMHGDVGIDKLSEFWSACVAAGFARNGHDDVGGLGAVDQLVEPIDAAQHGDGIGLGMEGQMTAPGPQARGSGMTGIDEADDRQSVPRASCPRRRISRRASRRAPTSTTRLRAGRRPGLATMALSRVLFMNRHRSLGDDTAPGALRELGPDGLDPGRTILGTLARFGFLQALRSTEPTLNLSYSENER